jgi:hypothetical protein
VHHEVSLTFRKIGRGEAGQYLSRLAVTKKRGCQACPLRLRSVATIQKNWSCDEIEQILNEGFEREIPYHSFADDISRKRKEMEA